MKTLLRIIFPVLMLISSQLQAQHVYNYAGKFNGTTSRMSISNTTETNLVNGYTIEAWVYYEHVQGTSKMIFGDTSGVSLGIGTSGSLSFSYHRSATALLDFFPVEKWTHVAVTYDRVTANVYINGVLTNSIHSPGNIPLSSPYSYIGGFQYNHNIYNPFKGMLDDIRIWTKAKTLYEVNRDMNLSLANTKPTGAYQGLGLSIRFDHSSYINDEGGFDPNSIGFVAMNWENYSNINTNRTSYNSSLILDGINSFCVSPPHIKQNASTALTVESWAKVDRSGPRNAVQEIMSKTSTGNAYTYRMFLKNDSIATFIVNAGSEYKLEAPVANPFVWNHIAGTYNAVSGRMNLYINGNLAKTENKTPASLQGNQSDSLYIGKCGMSLLQDSKFKGQLDEIRIWAETERSQAQIKQYMNQGINFKTEPVQNVYVYGFDGRTDDVTSNIFSTPATALAFYGNAYMRSAAFYSPVYSTSPLLWQEPGNFVDNTWNFSAKAVTLPLSGAVSDSILYASNGNVQAPKVMVMINSENIHKVKVKLIAPDGTTVQLTPEPSSAAAKSDMMTIFSDNSAQLVTYDENSLAPFSANAKPYQPLSALNGKNRKGWWKLKIETAGLDSEGQLVKWGMQNSELTVAEENHSIVKSYKLEQNYPNPFNPSTTIAFDIPKEGFAKLAIYDMSGRMIAELVNGNLKAGTYKHTFNAGSLASGVYFYKLEAGEFTETKKMILIK